MLFLLCSQFSLVPFLWLKIADLMHEKMVHYFYCAALQVAIKGLKRCGEFSDCSEQSATKNSDSVNRILL